MSDIDVDPPEAPSGAKRAVSPLLLSTITTKRVKLDVPQDELTSLNAELNRRSRLWSTQLQLASEDPSDMTSLLSTISNSLPQRDFSPWQLPPTNLTPRQRPRVFLSSVGGSIYLFSNEGRSEPCDCMPCLVGNTKETSTSSLSERWMIIRRFTTKENT